MIAKARLTGVPVGGADYYIGESIPKDGVYTIDAVIVRGWLSRDGIIGAYLPRHIVALSYTGSPQGFGGNCIGYWVHGPVAIHTDATSGSVGYYYKVETRDVPMDEHQVSSLNGLWVTIDQDDATIGGLDVWLELSKKGSDLSLTQQAVQAAFS